MKSNYILQSEKQQRKALEISQSLDIVKVWEKMEQQLIKSGL